MTDKEISYYKVSVIIPAYNAANHICRAVDSILSQSYPAHEIIVVDDGSTDNTAEVIKKYGNQIRYLYQKNTGVSTARNIGIEASTGNWIAFNDSDDEWLLNRLEMQIKHLQKYPSLNWTFANMFFYRQEWQEFRKAHQPCSLIHDISKHEQFKNYFTLFANGIFCSIQTVLIFKEVFKTTGMFSPEMKLAEDTDLWFRIGYQYPDVGYLEKPVAIYHLDTPNSASKIHDQAAPIIDFVKRHQKISIEFNRHEDFSLCAARLVELRVRYYIQQKRFEDAHAILNNLSEYLSRRLKKEIRFRLIWPPFSSAIIEVYFTIKRLLRKLLDI